MQRSIRLLYAAPLALAIVVPAAAAADTVRLHRDDVIPVVMRTELNFKTTREGDHFTADVTDASMLPWGSRLEGLVKQVERKRGDRPGFMDIEFTTIVLPDGHRSSFHGTPIALSKNYVTRDRYGRWEAKKGVKKETVVLGATAGGLILGALINKPFEGAFVGALLGVIGAEADKEDVGDGNIVIPKGSKVGARLDGDLTLDYDGRWSDTGDRYGDYDREGYNRAGYDRYGYDRRGRYDERYDTQKGARDGYGRTGSRNPARGDYNAQGYDRNGYDRNGNYNPRYDTGSRDPSRGDYNAQGYDRYGYDRNGDYNPRYDTTRDSRSGDYGRYDDRDLPIRTLTVEIGDRTMRYGNDQRPYQIGDVVMVPLEATADQLHISVSKDRFSRSITLTTEDDELALEQDSKSYRLNDRRDSLPAQVEVKSGVTFVPVDVFAMLRRGSVYVNGTRY